MISIGIEWVFQAPIRVKKFQLGDSWSWLKAEETFSWVPSSFQMVVFVDIFVDQNRKIVSCEPENE